MNYKLNLATVQSFYNMLFRGIFFVLKFFKNILNKLHSSTKNAQICTINRQDFRLLMKSETDQLIIHSQVGKVEKLYLPKIFKLSHGGEVRKLFKNIDFFQFSDVSYMLNSDFIRFNNKTVFCDKLSRIEMEFMTCGDGDFLKYNNRICTLRNSNDSIYFDCVFHLTGCFFSVWTHFLVQYFSKLDFIKLIPNTEKVAIVLPANIDEHILFLIEQYIIDFNNVYIKIVEIDKEIKAKKMFYVSLDSWIGDVGKASSLFHIQVSDFTNDFILGRAQLLLNKNIEIKKQKLFIGRNGKRNILNYSEIWKYFESLGFIEIFPHKLSFTEKLELFSSADFIVGPLSSGFANIIFCNHRPNVLILSNPSRHDDMYLTKFSNSLNINLMHFLGSEIHSGNSDSDYHIDIQTLKDCLASFEQ
jgi:hypothetical protein